MDLLRGMLKKINNPYSTVAVDGIIGGDVSYYVDTGNYLFNALVSGKIRGGIPSGKVVALAGSKGSGKTFILLKIIKNFLDEDLERNVALFESEGAITQQMLIDRGVDINRISIIPVSTVEEFRHQVSVALDYIDSVTPEGTHPKIMLALDSLGMVGTAHEIATAVSNDNKADMGKRAQLIKSVFRIITLRLGIMQIPMILTNHTYEGMSQYETRKMSGGSGLEFAASIIIFLSKTKVVEKDEKVRTHTGNNVTFKVEKGRFTIEGSSTILEINFKTGISRYSGIIDEMIAAGIIQQNGAWYSYGDLKVQGKDKFYDNAEEYVTDEILDKIDPYIRNKYMYGVGEENNVGTEE